MVNKLNFRIIEQRTKIYNLSQKKTHPLTQQEISTILLILALLSSAYCSRQQCFERWDYCLFSYGHELSFTSLKLAQVFCQNTHPQSHLLETPDDLSLNTSLDFISTHYPEMSVLLNALKVPGGRFYWVNKSEIVTRKNHRVFKSFKIKFILKICFENKKTIHSLMSSISSISNRIIQKYSKRSKHFCKILNSVDPVLDSDHGQYCSSNLYIYNQQLWCGSNKSPFGAVCMVCQYNLLFRTNIF